MDVLSANKKRGTSEPASLAPFFSRTTAVPQMLLENVTATGCLHIHIKIVFQKSFCDTK